MQCLAQSEGPTEVQTPPLPSQRLGQWKGLCQGDTNNKEREPGEEGGFDSQLILGTLTWRPAVGFDSRAQMRRDAAAPGRFSLSGQVAPFSSMPRHFFGLPQAPPLYHSPPIVLSWYSWNCPLTKRRTRLDLPTADSPSRTSLN